MDAGGWEGSVVGAEGAEWDDAEATDEAMEAAVAAMLATHPAHADPSLVGQGHARPWERALDQAF